MRWWTSLVVAGALCAGTQGALVAPTLAARGAASGRSTVSPCQAARLQMHPHWIAGADSIDGQITVINRSSAPCVVTAYPQISIAAGGKRLAVTKILAPFGPSGPPVRALELAPGQKASLAVHWDTGCADRSIPRSLIIALTQGGQVMIPIRLVAHGARPAPSLCSKPAAPSRLLVSPVQPVYDPGIVDLLTFYRLINAHQFLAAYRETADQYTSPSHFVAGYAQTRSLAIDLLAVPLYRVEDAGASFACVGIRLTAYERTGAAQVFGGWMMTEVRGDKVGWVVPEGSHLRPRGTAVIPTRATCAAAIPTHLRR